MRRLLTVLSLVLGLASVLVHPLVASAKSGDVYVLRIEGAIVPVTADYFDRGMDVAESNNAAAAIIVLDTPGGMLEPTRTIVERILNAKVPVVAYVSHWAASAGTFITIASPIAAMAPASRMGAASPVSIGPGGGQPSTTEEQKITQDTAAWARSLATLRGRNEAQAELAVTQAKSFDVEEALQYHLVDLQANTLNDLVSLINGRNVTIAGGMVTIDTTGKYPKDVNASWIESLLQTISNPNIAYGLLVLGMIGLIAELVNPGMVFPGVIGGISLLLGLYALGVLNAYWGGVMLILLAFGLFVADVFVTGYGILTVGGLASFVIGSVLLFSGRSPMLQVSPWLIALTAALLAAFFGFVVAAAVRAHRHPPTTGREGMVGEVATTLTRLDPEGTVFVEGEHWTATSEEGIVESGQKVVVTKMEGLRLQVRRK